MGTLSIFKAIVGNEERQIKGAPDVDFQIDGVGRIRTIGPAGDFAELRRQWDLALAGRAQVGNYMYNNILSNNAHYSQLRNGGVIRNVPIITEELNFDDAELLSDYFIQDASFLRLDHVTLGYNFLDLIPQISNLKVYATIQNPLLFTNYTGIDPETNEGIDKEIYPRSRTFLFGVNARF